MNTDTDSIYKDRLLMIPAEQADGVDYLINLPQAVAVHCPIQFIEVFADRFIVHAVELGVALIYHLQNRFRIADIGMLLQNVVPQVFKIGFQVHHLLKCW